MINKRLDQKSNKGFSIPLVVTLVIILSIAIYSIQLYTSQAARAINLAVNLKKAEYMAQAGITRAAAFIVLQGFDSRIYKSAASFSFGFTNTYSENYFDGKFSVTIIDIPAIIQNFDSDFKIGEYLGVLMWSAGHYKNASKYVLARYIPGTSPLRMFNYKKIVSPDDDFEYVDIELN
ncbi:MAG: hypothetical protein ACD_47C00098G0003 [uncultured bacterium]|nr:MAG: hypothetical protein ACD_47C00098G0003 [uncultured bacterium]